MFLFLTLFAMCSEAQERWDLIKNTENKTAGFFLLNIYKYNKLFYKLLLI